MKGNQLFVIALSGLGLMGFSQLLIAGMALAVRLEESNQVRIVEREVEKIVPITIKVPAPPEPAKHVPPVLPPVPEPDKVELPQIADPLSERLFKEGRKARIAGDMGLAIVKLEEAMEESPEDPTVLFELGMVHEMMGVFGEASRYYEQVFQLGVGGAGGLYEAAATKLRDGFEMPTDMLGKVALGRVRIFKDNEAEGGQRVILTVPVEKAPGEDVDSQEIEVEVMFFNKTNKGKIIQLEDQSWAIPQWASLPFDWAGGEESLRMTYQIPQRDAQTAHLFGELEYYGQVVTLTYKGEVLDVQAWPRDLAARIGQAAPEIPQGNDFPEFLDQDILPPNFDPDIPLLNPLLPE
ncbi:tetratricopeptide repeat protein [Luteolibacter sp. AS25]|uniref:tetratricopeptide repeat protein n=1 Tax=Luteolibacter sp. AS25 TaxID=3135776 RepID=UPI00398B64A9